MRGNRTSRGRGTTRQDLDVETIRPPRDIAVRLALDPDKDLCLVRRHVRYIDGKPGIISDDYFDEAIVRGTELAAPEDTTREDILKEAGYEQVYDVDEIVTRMPTPAEARRLSLGPGQPVAEHTRTGYTAQDKAVRVMLSVIPGDLLVLRYVIPLNCRTEPFLDQERRRRAESLAHRPPGSGLRTHARHGRAEGQSYPLVAVCCGYGQWVRWRPFRQDFRWWWASYSVSSVGSGIGAGALPIVAVLVLRVSALDVSMLLALSGLAGAATALPLGTVIEPRRKRPAMIIADLSRFLALGSVPLAVALGGLTFAQLCLVGIVQTAAAIAFNAASGAHLKALVEPAQRIVANSRLEAVTWISQTIGPPIGGLLINLTGATTTMAIDAASFLLSAVGVRRIRSSEPEAPQLQAARHVCQDLVSGWRYIFAHRGLRGLFANAMLFGGPVMMTSSLLPVFMLRTLSLTPRDYGLALGLPCLGGVIGSRLTPCLTRRFGQRRLLLATGVLRTPWMVLLPFARPGGSGLLLILISETCLLLAAGVFNPTFSTYRMEATGDGFMARVSSSWSVSSKVIQPLFITAGGLLTTVVSIQAILLTAGIVCISSALLLPWWAGAIAHAAEPATAIGERAA